MSTHNICFYGELESYPIVILHFDNSFGKDIFGTYANSLDPDDLVKWIQ